MAMATIQAPSGNFTTTITTETTAVTLAPVPFITARQRHPDADCLRRNQCTTIPDCEMVKLVNTPTAYRGIILLTFAWKMMIRKTETKARPMMPFEKTRRSPRFWNCRGTKPSRARMDESRGKSAKLVWAATTKMAIVAIWRAKYSTVPLPYTERAIWLI